jgi:hypothetical protein
VKESRKISKGESTSSYATGGDFCWIFKEDMQNLYGLSLLLTADREKAEQCFVAGLDDCASGNQVFKEWARSWARRAIIKRAIRLIAPTPANGNANGILQTAAVLNHAEDLELPSEFSALLDLQSFERFVFVMSVLEGYSDRECELLLGCTHQVLIIVRVRALRQLARLLEVRDENQAGASLRTEKLRDEQGSLIKLVLPAQLATSA